MKKSHSVYIFENKNVKRHSMQLLNYQQLLIEKEKCVNKTEGFIVFLICIRIVCSTFILFILFIIDYLNDSYGNAESTYNIEDI